MKKRKAAKPVADALFLSPDRSFVAKYGLFLSIEATLLPAAAPFLF